MTPDHRRFKTWSATMAILALLIARSPGHVGASVAASGAHSSAGAAQPTIYMVGSVTNNTFWAAVKAGFEQGGKDFNLHAIYEAPGVHSSAGSIPLITAATAAHPDGIAINYTDKSIQAPTLNALSSG